MLWALAALLQHAQQSHRSRQGSQSTIYAECMAYTDSPSDVSTACPLLLPLALKHVGGFVQPGSPGIQERQAVRS